MIVNTFGGQEGEGRGFCQLTGTALMAGIPVLLAVGQGDLERFLTFAETLAEPFPADPAKPLAWRHARIEACRYSI